VCLLYSLLYNNDDSRLCQIILTCMLTLKAQRWLSAIRWSDLGPHYFLLKFSNQVYVRQLYLLLVKCIV